MPLLVLRRFLSGSTLVRLVSVGIYRLDWMYCTYPALGEVCSARLLCGAAHGAEVATTRLRWEKGMWLPTVTTV